MGVVIKQSIQNSILSYAGIMVGFINVVLFSKYFAQEQFGLTRVFIAAGAIVAQFGALGMTSAVLKFFPLYKTEDGRNEGFLSIVVLIPLIGYFLFLALALFNYEAIVEYYSEKSFYIGDNFGYLLYFSFLILYINLFDNYLRALFSTVFAGMVRNLLLRLATSLLIGLYAIKVLDFDHFIFWFVNIYAIALAMLIGSVYQKGQLRFHRQFFKGFKSKHFKELLPFAGFALLGTGAGTLATQMDVLMINELTFEGEKNVAIYSIGLYVATLVLVPFNSLARIVNSFIAAAWKENDTNKIEQLYKQSSNMMMIVCTLIFLGIWLNVDIIFQYLGKDGNYDGAKSIVFFIGLAKLFDAYTGVNAPIIQYSPFYKLMLLFNVIMAVIVVITNYLLIPEYGINGAAIATLSCLILMNTLRMLVIKVKLGMLPFNRNSLLIFAIGLLTYFIVGLIPYSNVDLLDLPLRSTIITLMFLVPIYLMKLSNDFNNLVNSVLKRLRIMK